MDFAISKDQKSKNQRLKFLKCSRVHFQIPVCLMRKRKRENRQEVNSPDLRGKFLENSAQETQEHQRHTHQNKKHSRLS